MKLLVVHRWIAAWVLVTLLLLSCRQANQPVYLVYSVDSLHIPSRTIGRVEMDAYATIPTPCFTFDHNDFISDSNHISIRIFTRATARRICPDVLSVLKAKVELPIFNAGIYHLHFIAMNANLDTTIEVKQQPVK